MPADLKWLEQYHSAHQDVLKCWIRVCENEVDEKRFEEDLRSAELGTHLQIFYLGADSIVFMKENDDLWECEDENGLIATTEQLLKFGLTYYRVNLIHMSIIAQAKTREYYFQPYEGKELPLAIVDYWRNFTKQYFSFKSHFQI